MSEQRVSRTDDSAPRFEWPAWPTYGLQDDLLPTLTRWARSGHAVALATLVHITGSSPRPLGSEMAINDRGEVVGYVSGGCVEAAVAAEARCVIGTGRPVMLDYGAGSPVLDVQLTCGGRISIFVRALPDLTDFVERLTRARQNRTPLSVLIDFDDGTHRLGGPCPLPQETSARRFTQCYLPPARLVCVGSDPVTLALCRLAPALGFEATLLRPYGPSAPPADTPLVHYDTRRLDTALAAVGMDAWTAVYTLTHDMNDDHQVLDAALRSPAFSIGALGSRAKSIERTARLRAAGHSDADLDRLQTPAGLNIGARNPQEIALSVMAELVASRPRVTARVA